MTKSWDSESRLDVDLRQAHADVPASSPSGSSVTSNVCINRRRRADALCEIQRSRARGRRAHDSPEAEHGLIPMGDADGLGPSAR